jgi:hypothetical protein
MATGWAYINCTASTGGASATGPTGSIQFHTSGSNQTGSAALMYFTSSKAGSPPSTLVLTGTLIVSGAITASAYKIIDTEVISGSTIFGNSADDIHLRTGSLNVVSSAVGAVWTSVTPVLSSSATNHMTYMKSIRGNYFAVTGTVTLNGGANLTKRAYLYGVIATANTTITLDDPRSNGAKQGHIMVVKDQVLVRTSSLILSKSAVSGLIEGGNYYQLTGTMPAINLYSDGTNWFVF